MFQNVSVVCLKQTKKKKKCKDFLGPWDRIKNKTNKNTLLNVKSLVILVVRSFK